MNGGLSEREERGTHDEREREGERGREGEREREKEQIEKLGRERVRTRQ